MEAFSISPVTASHQTAEPPGAPQGTPQGPRGLGDVFAALLREATIRLDARPADLASFETRRSSGEPPRKMSATESTSSIDSRAVDSNDRRDDAGFRAHGVENDAAAPDPIAPIAPADTDTEAPDDSEFTAPAPEDDAAPRAAAGDATPEPNADDIQLAEGEDTEAPAAQDEAAPVPEEIAAPAALPVQAQSLAATRATTQSGVPAQAAQQAHAASNVVPAAGRLGVEGGATRVQITPAAVVAQPNAALGGGAAVAALAAEAGPAAAQNGAQNAWPGLPNAASETAATATGQAALQPAKPGHRTGLNGPVAGGPVASDTASRAQSATVAQNGSGPTHAASNAATNAVQRAVTAVETAPASSLQGQSQSAPGQGAPGQGATGLAAGEPSNPNPRNAQTTFAESNHQNAGNSGTPGGLSAAASASEAGVQNRLGQNARTGTAQTATAQTATAQASTAQTGTAQASTAQTGTAQTSTAQTSTAQSLAATVPGADDAASAEGSQQPGASRAATGTTQGAHPAALESNQNNTAQNNTAQTARAEGPAQAGVAAQAAAQNARSGSAVAGTAAAAERALALASAQRTEGAGQANANNPMAGGTPGLTLAAARTPQTLPAQARPATAASLPAHQVAVHIQRAVAAGQGRITISLHPAELGQIDVKLNIGNDGTVKAIISIERPETFELLQRDARGLEKALQDAGLKTDSGSLSFNLKGQSEQDTAAGRNGLETGSHDGESDTPAEPEPAPDIIAAAPATGAGRILDLHV